MLTPFVGACTLILVLHTFVTQAHAHAHAHAHGDSERRRPVVLPSTVRLDRVRHCRRFADGVCKEYALTRRAYRPFLHAALPAADLDHLYIAQVIAPRRRSAVRNLVVSFPGQQLRFPRKSQVTGQQEGYNSTFGPTDAWRRVPVGESMHAAVMRTGLLPRGETFVATVFAPRFNYEFAIWRKRRIVRAYVAYIRSRMSVPRRMKTIYLVGHSRGGCLIVQVAARLVELYPRTRIVVQTLDPVCATVMTVPELGIDFKRAEFGVGPPTHMNPLNPQNYYAFTTNVKHRFRYRTRRCLYVSSFVGGEAIVLPLIRAFGHSGFVNASGTVHALTYKGVPYYRQQFMNKTHTGISEGMFNNVVSEFIGAMGRFPSDCNH